MTPTPTDQSERDREVAEMILDWIISRDDSRHNDISYIATALTRARAEGVREGVERAALRVERIESEFTWPQTTARAIRALADSPAGREGTA